MNKIYLDQASTSFPKAPSVADAVYHYLSKAPVNVNRGTYQDAYDTEEQIFETREQLLKLFHFSSGKGKNVIFTPNITTSLNVLLKGLLKPGDHVLVTSMEHNAVMRPLVQLTGQGVIFDRIPCTSDGSLLLEQAKKLLTPRTRLLVCLHASNVCGTIMPAREIGQFCREHGLLFILDTAQTAGTIPVDMEDFQISALAFTGHKGLLGPPGTGGLYVKKGIEIRPLKSGGSGVQSYSKRHPRQMPTALEAGTLNAHGIAGLHAALDYLTETGIGTIREKEQALMWEFYEKVRKIPGVIVYGDFSGKERCPIVTLNFEDVDSAELSDALFTEYGISTRPGVHCAPLMHEALGTVEQGAVRFSFSHYNTEKEILTAVEALKELAEL